MSVFPIVTPSAGAELPVREFLQATVDLDNLTSYSFEDENFGAARTDREIIALVFWVGSGAGRTLNSASIGGVAADIRTQVNDPTLSSQPGCAIIQANVPTGTSGTVALTFSGGCLRAAIGLYRVTGLDSRTPVDTGNDTDDVLTPAGISDPDGFDVPAGGLCIAGGIFVNAGDVVFTDNANPDLIAEDFDQSVGEDNYVIAGGSAQNMPAVSPYRPFVDGPNGNAAGVAAAWR